MPQVVKGKVATAARLPVFVKPQLATLVSDVPRDAGWLHELKLDGYRLLARIDGQRVRLLTRAGNDWTSRFPEFAMALKQLGVHNAMLDGEAVVLDASGRSHFQSLQKVIGDLADRDRARLALYLFDILFLDGRDLRTLPLVERKRVLRKLLEGAPGILRYNDHVEGNGTSFLSAACAAGVEGVVSKRASAPYESGRSRAWLKIKCSRRQEFVIVGFTDPEGSRAGLGALLLAAHDGGGRLQYSGKVGTGFSGATLLDLRRRLSPLEQPSSSAAGSPRGRGIHWVRPELVAEVAFTEWTGDGRIRHPSFMGLREDKKPRDVRIERESEPAAPAEAPRRSPVVAGVRLSHPDRVYFPDIHLTKLDLAVYYEAVSRRALPLMTGRPLTLVRCPEGIAGPCFYQKRARDTIPKNAPRVKVRVDRLPYTMITDLASLIGLVQVGVLEFHVWGSRADRLDRPDMIVFDLDPGPGVEWKSLVDLALEVREWLSELKLQPFAKVTGGKGVHVVVPLVRRSTWAEVKDFAHATALEMVRRHPTGVVANMSKAKRGGKVFLDYLRNDPESTSIAAYSVRRRPGAPVALPLSWDELQESTEVPHYGPRDVMARMAQPDPWEDFEAARRPLLRAALVGRAAAR